VTAYHGFYGDSTINTATDPDRYSIFPPSYAVSWNAHPDFASGDRYIVYFSDDLSQAIDPTDSNTYLGSTSSQTTSVILETRPVFTHDGVTYNDGYLENTPLRMSVFFEDDSKGDLLSPATEITPTMASESHREWGDLRIHGGFFKDGDNSTLYGFGRSNTSYPIRIEHKDMVNVGERVIFDGAWLKSDVFPLMGNSAGYDFMFLTWYQPARPAFNHNFSTDGTYFKRSRTSDWRLESNTISPNSICGANNAEDCDFAMELQAEDTVGLIIQNSDGRQYKGSGIGYTNTGSGTLNGPTDYAANDYTTWFAGNGRYTKEHTGSSHWLDNSSYAGMTLFSTKNMYQINLANADAAISKVAIPFPPPDNLSVSASGSDISLSWDNSTSFTNTYDIYRSTDNASWSLVTSISGYTNTTYTDSSLADGTYYYKIGANGTYYTPDNSTVASGVIATASPALKYSITGNDNDVSEDGTSDTTSLNLYLDTAPDGNVVVDITVSDPTELAIGSTQLTFTPTNYMNTQNWSVTGVDDALDDGDIVSQVTISINGAGTTDTTGYASLGNKNKNIRTLDDDSAPVLNSVTAGTLENTLSWTAFPNETGYRIYWSTSSPVTTSDNLIDNIPTGTTSYQHSGRTAGTTYYYAFMANTAVGYSSLSNELSGTPIAITTPTLSADARAQAIYLTWNLPAGTDNATIYWRTSGGVFEGSPTAPTVSDNVINAVDNQTSYLLTGLTGGDYYHFVIFASNSNGDSPVSSVLGNVQPTSFIANTFEANNGGICKIQNDGSLKCKGRNHLDQYDNSRTAHPAAVDVFGITNAETISHAHNKVSVIKSDGTYQHRGDNDGMSTRTSPVTGVSNPIQVGQGNNFVAYLMSDGTVRTRGANYNGQLGDGTTNNETSGSVQVSGITTATKIGVGQYHACALLSNGQVWCWGNNSQGSIGDGTTTHRSSPVQANLPTDTAVDIFVEGITSAAVLANGKVYIWGSNLNSKAKCDTNTSKITTPRELTAVSNVKQIDFGSGHSVILTNDGNVYTCGTVYSTSNVAGNAAFSAYMAGIPSTVEKTNGAILMDDYQGRVVEVRATGYNSFMLLDNGSLVCIGDNEYGQCNNDGSTMGTDQLTPIIIPDL
jgi:hypothetical protein